MLHCLAVDDEPLALGLVCAFIEQTPFLHLAGRCTSAVEALQVLHAPDHGIELLFLDIQMPGLDGLELARTLERGRAPGTGPRIIFTTAYHQYALEGYRVDALDYLVKPFNYEEFLRAATKARAYAEQQRQPAGTESLPPAPAPAATEEDYLFLKVEYQLVRVALADILYIEGLKDYVKVYLRSAPRPLLSLTSLKGLEEKLPARRFLRVHRSYIVALDKIEAVRRNTIQIGDAHIAVGEQYKDAFTQFLSRWS